MKTAHVIGLGALLVAALYGASRLLWPVRGVVTSGFQTDERPDHNGIDIRAAIGTPALAPLGGYVLDAFFDNEFGGGNTLRMELDNGLYASFAHLSAFLVAPGDRFAQGQPIAVTGNTGNTTGPHLHFALKKAGRWVDPLAYLA